MLTTLRNQKIICKEVQFLFSELHKTATLLIHCYTWE